MWSIAETETLYEVPRILKEKLVKSKVYVEILLGPGPDDTVQCSDYDPGEAYPEEDVELPPYHTNCQCEAVFYETEELQEILKDEI